MSDAIVIGASGGIGAALVRRLSEGGGFERVIGLSRSAGDIDLEDEASIAAAAARLEDAGVSPALLIVATGILHHGDTGPEKSLRDLDAEWLARVYRINAIGPALVARHFLPLLPRKAPATFAAIGARVGSVSDNRLGGWYGYRASKAALHMMIRNIAIEWGRRNDRAIAVALHPGTVDTPLSAPFQANVPGKQLFTPDRSAGHLLNVLGRLTPAQSGRIFAWDGEEIRP